MTWRDLDISLEMKELDETKFFQMGGRIASTLKPWRMSYRNEVLAMTPDLPSGFYFGVHTSILGGPEEWKIDIWAIDVNEMVQRKKELADLQAGTKGTLKRIILEIKNYYCKHPEYRYGFHSLDVYQAVIEAGIKTSAGFAKWMKETKGLDLQKESPRYSSIQKEGR